MLVPVSIQSPVDDSHVSDHARDKRPAPPSSRTDPKSEFAEELFYDALKRVRNRLGRYISPDCVRQ